MTLDPLDPAYRGLVTREEFMSSWESARGELPGSLWPYRFEIWLLAVVIGLLLGYAAS